MSALPFNNSIPASANNPANDQPLMLINNQSEFTIWTRDHIGYTVNNSGQHLQCSFPGVVSPASPTSISSILFPYTDSGAGGSGLSQLKFLNSTNSTQYSTNNGNASTVLFGGFILKFGTTSFAGGNRTLSVTFGAAFPTAAIAVYIFAQETNANKSFTYQVVTFNTSTLLANVAASGGNYAINWFALGN